MSKLLSIIILLIFPISSQAAKFTSIELEEIRAKHKIPGLAVIFSDGSIDKPKTLVAGLRKIGSPEKIQPTDKFYLGIIAHSFTATLAAKLVEEGKISFDTTIEDVYSNNRINEENKKITLADLLGHRGGIIKGNLSYSSYLSDNLQKMEIDKSITPEEIRTTQSKEVIANWPFYKPKSDFRLSNIGYHLAGNTLENKAKIPYEKLLKDKLLTPLKMNTCSIGLAAKEGPVSQPWGHEYDEKNKTYKANLIEKPHYGVPSGSMNCSLQDIFKFLKENTLGHKGKGSLLTKDSYQMLHSPYSKNEGYGLGWILSEGYLANGGSNGSHYFVVYILPEKNKILAVASNSGSEATRQAITEVYYQVFPEENPKK